MKPQEKYCRKQVCLLVLLIAGMGLLLLLSVQFLHHGIPCPFFALTGLRCPFCGMTRAVFALLSGNLPGAWSYNPMFLPYFIILLFLGFTQARRFVLTGSCFFFAWEKRLYIGSIVFSLVWMLLRNIFCI